MGMSHQQKPEGVERIFMYVPHSWVEKALEIGWENPTDLGPPHNNYSMLMEWKKDSNPIMPFRSREKHYERR